MRIVALFLWVLVPLALWVGIAVFGTPHVIGSYTYIGPSYQTPADRRYIDCTYYGWTGARRVPAISYTCPWIRFFKAGS